MTYLRAFSAAQIQLNLVHELLNGIGADRPLGARLGDAGPKLLPTERLSAPVLLHHHNFGNFRPLVRGESPAAGGTPTAPSGDGSVLGVTLVQDFGREGRTIRATHARMIIHFKIGPSALILPPVELPG
jgi:hypothetical protein